MRFIVKRTDDEIAALQDAIAPAIEAGRSQYGGMTFEQGIDETLMWLCGDSDEPPIPINDEE